MTQTYEEALAELQAHPEVHRHSYQELLACCTLSDASGHGVLVDRRLMDAHTRFVDLGTNGGIRCDVLSGPCNCGATHRDEADYGA
jgi:hypothetical protein